MKIQMNAWYGKNGDVRIDTNAKHAGAGPNSKNTTVFPAKGDEYYMISHEKKTIVVGTYEALRKSKPDPKNEDDANISIKKLGKEKINGIMTEHIRVTDKEDGSTADLWMTQKYPADLWTQAFRGRGLGMDFSGNSRAKAMKKYGIKPGFAIKMKTTGKDQPTVVFVVDEIKKKKVPASMFAVPTDYKRVEVPTMPAGGQGMQGAPRTKEEAEAMRKQILEQMEKMKKDMEKRQNQ